MPVSAGPASGGRDRCAAVDWRAPPPAGNVMEVDTMGFLRNAVKSGVALKAVQVVRREAAKPENQRKAREFAEKLRNRRR